MLFSFWLGWVPHMEMDVSARWIEVGLAIFLLGVSYLLGNEFSWIPPTKLVSQWIFLLALLS